MENMAQYPVLMNAPFGFASYQVVYNDDGKPVEYRFLQVNKVFENITGLKGKNVIGKTLREVLSGFLDNQFDWISNFAEIAEKCTAKTFEQFSNSLGIWLKVHVSAIKKGYLELYFDEISHEHHFAQAVKELTGFSMQNIDYRKIACWMKVISGAEYVVLNKFDKEGKSFTTVGVSGISANIERAVQLLGFQIEGKKWDYDPFRERQIKESKITRFNSLGELTSRVFSKPMIKLLETTFYIGEMVLVKSTKNDKLVGDFTLIFGKNKHLKNKAFVESIADITGSTMAKIDAEQALAESETKYRMIAENSSDVIWLIGLDLSFIYVSPSTTRLFGYTLEERQQGKISLINLLLPDEFIKLKGILAREIEEYRKTGNERSIIFETTGKHKNGNLLSLQVSARFVFDENGRITAVQGTTRDISERKKYEQEFFESEARFKALHNASFGGLAIHDKGIILDCNLGLAKMTGFTVDELVGMNGLLLIAEQTREMVLQNILSGVEHPYEAVGLRKDGTTFPLRIEARNIPYKGKQVRSVEFRDITIQKNHETELIIAREKAEESDRLKSAFLANMSHEIRTPMNGILGFTSLLNTPGLSGEDRHKYIEIIEKSGQRMLSTVNDLIDISKIETGQVSLYYSLTNIHERINAIYEFFKPEAEAKNLAFQLKIELAENETELETDISKFDSILTNLVKNAIKFTNKGLIEIGCQWLTQPDAETPDFVTNSILVSVKDTGIGIPASRQTKIFNRFEQVETEDTRFYEGAGLGLTIAKAYTEMLGGKIWLESEIGKGTVFYFNLPACYAEVPVSLKATAERFGDKEKSHDKLKIMIAEDDDDGFFYLETILKPMNPEILHCDNGLSAVEMCKSNPDIDIILMDIRMPVMNGFDATRKIREFNTHVVIIAQTAFALAGDKENAIDAGCTDYIAKPIKREELLTLINRYIEGIQLNLMV